MTVFILSVETPEGGEIIGIFATREEAERELTHYEGSKNTFEIVERSF